MPYFVLEPDHSVRMADDFSQWMLWVRKHHDAMEVAVTVYPDCHVRTTFLGVESRSEPPSDPPAVFETVIIGGPHDARTVTACTWTESQRNHVRVSELVAKEALWCDLSGAPSPFQE